MRIERSTWIWLVGGAIVGATLGYFGLFSERGGLEGAAIGACFGLFAVAWQFARDHYRESKVAREHAIAVRASREREGAAAARPPEMLWRPTHRVLWRRSKPARYWRIGLFLAVALAVIATVALYEADPGRAGDYVFLGLAVAAAFGFAFFMRHRAAREVARATRVAHEGRFAVAKVTSVEQKQWYLGRGSHIKVGTLVAYAYQDHQGRWHEGNSGFLPPADARRYVRGARATVVFDESEPSVSVWAEPPASRELSLPGSLAGPVKVIVILAALIALVPLGVYLGEIRDDEAGGFPWRDGAVELKPVSGLQGARLGESFAELVARKGPFDPDPAGKPGQKPPERGDFRHRDRALLVWVQDGRVRSVGHDCHVRGGVRLNRIDCGAPGYRIREVFGDAVRVLCAKVADDDPRKAEAAFARAFDVLATGTRYIVERDVVTGFIITAPSELEALAGADNLWHACPGG